jgi:hypothetical protein
MKMISTKQGWFIIDKGVPKFFENSRDAWMYVFLMKEIRHYTTFYPSRTLFPVKTLDPRPSMMKKRVVIA